MSEQFNSSMAATVTTIGAATAAAATLAVIYLIRSKNNQKQMNPFKSDTRVEPQPYENDKLKRDCVLKNGYSSKKISMIGSDFDAIVIGSGIGGLVAAALLSRAGKKVIVLEQHDQAGGCCHSFTEKGFEFDTGIHYIGEMRNNTAFRFLMDQLSNGQLGWANVCDDFDTVVMIDGNGNQVDSLRNIQSSIQSGTILPSRWVCYFRHLSLSLTSLSLSLSLFRFPTRAVAKKQSKVSSQHSQMKKLQLKNISI
jgi:hypothetical protein